VTVALYDLNVVLDTLLERAPHAAMAAQAWELAETRRVEAWFPAHGVTTIHYIAQRHRGKAIARRVVEAVLAVFAIAPVDGAVVRRALLLEARDFEDATCIAAAESAGCSTIVTRDPGDFRGAALTVVSPEAFVASLRGA
jgi:predicted nucleic acid-binding protein